MQGPESMVRRLEAATNAHDLEGLVSCFSEGYENVTPVHPARSFRGSDRVRRNWEQFFGAIPDLKATVVGAAYGPDEAWTEWEMQGTRPDGSPHHLRGVIIFRVEGEVATSCRFYLEPVDPDPGTIEDTVRSIAGRP